VKIGYTSASHSDAAEPESYHSSGHAVSRVQEL
jgi:hypothetical protein